MTPKNKKKFFKIINNAKIKNKISYIDFYCCFNEKFFNVAPEIALVFIFLSYSANKGHSCIPIKKFIKIDHLIKENKIFYKLFQLISLENKNWFNIIINNFLCSNGTQKTPLVLDRKYIYIYKYWYMENKIIEFIYHKNLKYNISKIEKYKQLIKKYCYKKIDNSQKNTIKNALLSHIFFIIGGPGTGKTSIVAYYILILIKNTNNKINIQLSAPTGKAATKLTQSIYYILNRTNISKKNRLSFPRIGITLHNLFKINKETNQCNLKNKYKNLDVLVIDECSMLDLNLMNIIIDNVNKKTKIIFIGDINQLPAIDTGSVLKNMFSKILTKIIKKKYEKIIYNHVSILKKKYRFNKNSGINTLATRLENNLHINISQFYRILYPDIIWKSLHTHKNYLYMLVEIKKYFIIYKNFIDTNNDPIKIIKKFNKYQVLCAVKEGMFGTKKINKYLNKWFIKNQTVYFKKNTKNENKKKFYHGKPILINKNNNLLRLMNGDIGICLLIKNKYKVFFMLSDQTVKVINPKILLNYESAWAITIHKSQGSEYSSVQIVIPNYYCSVLSKELFYTAITRAKKKITIYTDIKLLEYILKIHNIQYSGLNKKLKLMYKYKLCN
ncbi:RecBCD enzyme subunit RecD [Buchnera aphidicola (Cinara cuneomaculata)]|uniref:RecBCD enzyme subunit RecD n=1 Tax=Buchnera aphidicola (Cinara cuneomaculata) TaxID=1660040 RepID=A0A451CY28_9GAMM|nr:exodeoxyribonuclease V subunit alpha [Buchnera aphidicola]VFP78272.1 RecBCD enzyme subunit RecD [Buchnera aphidicola (Cinara cuneomaculata)]